MSLVFVQGIGIAKAVPPPDFLFNVGSQIIQAFSLGVLFLSAISASVWQFAKGYFAGIRHKKWIGAGIILLIISVSVAGAYIYGQYEQDKAYKDWVEESKEQGKDLPATDTSLDRLKINNESSSPQVELETERLPENKYVQFIKQYYDFLGNGKIAEAYAVSKKSVSLETYKSWYKNVTDVEVDEVQAINDHKYSLQLTLKEGDRATRYAVLMVLKEDFANLSVLESQVRLLSTEAASPTSSVSPAPKVKILQEEAQNDTGFFEQNKNLALAISNGDFQQVLDSQPSPYILDAREDEEYEIGNFPGSHHIRFADLMAGEWISLPTDKAIYVFCWSGIRGREVAEFLRSKKILSRYIQNGAYDWVTKGGLWDGGIEFLSKYKGEQYKRLFTLSELKKKMAEWVFIVDSRNSGRWMAWDIPGSVNIPIIYTPRSKFDDAFSQVPKGKAVITVCDDFVSCFDAKVVGVKLEKEGHEFLGRYNNPWEYRDDE